jgi:hypothetical protein
MTALTGTDKQIAWAEQIREQAITTVTALIADEEAETQKRIESLEFRRGSGLEARMERRLAEQREQEARTRDMVANTVSWMQAQASAGWWIEHQAWGAVEFVRKATGVLVG